MINGHQKWNPYFSSVTTRYSSHILHSCSFVLDALAMFRRPAAHLRRLVSPLLKRGGMRSRTTEAEQNFRPGFGYKPFWNSGRVLLFSAATGTTTYYYGVNDETPRFHVPWRKTPGPQYASKREMGRVRHQAMKSCEMLLKVCTGNRRTEGGSW